MSQLYADPTLNLAVVGAPDRWEIIQFMNADPVSDDAWLLTGLLRGRRGTERFTGTHQPGDNFVLYNSAVAKADMGASRLNDSYFYRAITFGKQEAEWPVQSDTFTGEANRPLSVANLNVVKNYSTGSFHGTWDRRTRLGGSSIDGQDVPLGETSELYNVRVLNGSETVHSEQVTSEAFEYDAYQQIADFGSEQNSLTIEVAQVSPALRLEGYPVQATG